MKANPVNGGPPVARADHAEHLPVPIDHRIEIVRDQAIMQQLRMNDGVGVHFVVAVAETDRTKFSELVTRADRVILEMRKFITGAVFLNARRSRRSSASR